MDERVGNDILQILQINVGNHFYNGAAYSLSCSIFCYFIHEGIEVEMKTLHYIFSNPD